MTEDELRRLLAACPVLFHMAEAGSWPLIRDRGLLSTSALLDLFEVGGDARPSIESARRGSSHVLVHPAYGRAVVRDNGPLSDRGLAALLDGGLGPADWYRLLNERAFFWLSRKRLCTLMAAYPGRAHDVLEVGASSLVAAHRDRIELSAINSGAIGRARMRRGRDTFRSIADFPLAERAPRPLRERVAELTVRGGVPDIARHVRRVVRMRGGAEEAVVWARPDLGATGGDGDG